LAGRRHAELRFTLLPPVRYSPLFFVHLQPPTTIYPPAPQGLARLQLRSEISPRDVALAAWLVEASLPFKIARCRAPGGGSAQRHEFGGRGPQLLRQVVGSEARRCEGDWDEMAGMVLQAMVVSCVEAGGRPRDGGAGGGGDVYAEEAAKGELPRWGEEEEGMGDEDGGYGMPVTPMDRNGEEAEEGGEWNGGEWAGPVERGSARRR
jgi:hypothetical protein